MKRVSVPVLLVLSTLLVSGVSGYLIVVLVKPQIPVKQAILFAETPLVVVFVVVGVMGLFAMMRSQGSWVRLGVGFVLVIVAWLFLEQLLMAYWTQRF